MNIQDEYDKEKEREHLANQQEKQEKEQERLDEDQRYKAEQTNNNISDPSAKRNIGLGGAQHRDDEKDQLHNLVIEGSEATGYGGDSPEDETTNQGGPGFGVEGGEFTSPPIRNNDQISD